MAYNLQPPYGAPQRPPYQDHQASYGYSRGHYPAKIGYGHKSQAAHFNSSPRLGTPQQYQISNGPSGVSYGYNEDWPEQGKYYDGGDGHYGGRGQNIGGRWPPAQRPLGRPIEAGRNPRNGSPSRAPSPGKGRHHQQSPYPQPNQYREPQGYEQRYQPEGMYRNGSLEHGNGEDQYDKYSLENRDNWMPTQSNNRPPHSDDQAYQDPEYGAEYPRQDRRVTNDRGISPGTYGADRSLRQPEAPSSKFNQTQPNFIRPQNPQHPKSCKSANK